MNTSAVPDPSDSLWQPSCDRALLRARSAFYRSIRDFFTARDVLEVETPVLSRHPVNDPNIQPIQTTPETAESRWLQTSPEYPMKRLLCAGSGDIWQLCKVFRSGEAGRKHNPEFSMLEWYRVGWDHRRLMDEVADLTSLLLEKRFPDLPRLSLTYAEAMVQFAGLQVHTADDAEIAELGQQLAGQDLELNRDGWLDLIMSLKVEPSLPEDTLVLIDAFPASQSALARVVTDPEGVQVAERFELFFNGAELANGYHELTDSTELAQRFQQYGEGREVDQFLLDAMASGMPDCAGVAMGVDRLLMHALGKNSISEVLAFDWERA